MITWKVAPIEKVLTHLEKQIAKGHRYGDDYNLSHTHGRVFDLQQAGLPEFPVPVEDGKIDYGLMDRISKGQDDDENDGRERVRTPASDWLLDQIREHGRARSR